MKLLLDTPDGYLYSPQRNQIFAMKKLIDIARIKPGYPFRGRLTKAPSGGVSVIQMKDVMKFFVQKNVLMKEQMTIYNNEVKNERN